MGISIVFRVPTDGNTLDRTVESVRTQSFPDWELIAAVEASNNTSLDYLRDLADKDSRIRVVQCPRNEASALRNLALASARGDFVVYLDQCDEYYPDYLSNVARLSVKADVLLFAYDMVDTDGGKSTWKPANIGQEFFVRSITKPIGVAHRRSLLEQVGGFNELLWENEESDLLRRFARAGCEFAFSDLRSGLHRLNRESAKSISVRQLQAATENWRHGKPLYWSPTVGPKKKPINKIAFMSPHCVVDFTNGAATATLEALRVLANNGFDCQAFCATWSDSKEEVAIEAVLKKAKSWHEVRKVQIGGHYGQLVLNRQGNVPVTLFKTASSRQMWSSEEEIAGFLSGCELFLTRNRPDVVFTYGGDPISCELHRLIKRLDIPIIFALHNFNYRSPDMFRTIDHAIVPSEFSQKHYWESMGMACQVLPYIIDPQRVTADHWEPHYVTFVNPIPRKGIHAFARIAEVLQHRRPDIPLLLVEALGQAKFVGDMGVDLAKLSNVTVMPNTSDPRNFYAKTKILLVPSLWGESCGLVAVEAMFNGIPVIASTRSALPETLGDAGILLDLPARCNQDSCLESPTEEEVEPWVVTIVRLWDDTKCYYEMNKAARKRADDWSPESRLSAYQTFLNDVSPQPGPPLLATRPLPS